MRSGRQCREERESSKRAPGQAVQIIIVCAYLGSDCIRGAAQTSGFIAVCQWQGSQIFILVYFVDFENAVDLTGALAVIFSLLNLFPSTKLSRISCILMRRSENPESPADRNRKDLVLNIWVPRITFGRFQEMRSRPEPSRGSRKNRPRVHDELMLRRIARTVIGSNMGRLLHSEELFGIFFGALLWRSPFGADKPLLYLAG